MRQVVAVVWIWFGLMKLLRLRQRFKSGVANESRGRLSGQRTLATKAGAAVMHV
jgi:hypothetical protein